MFTPVSRSARNHGHDGRSPLVLVAALMVAVPGLLVSACSGQSGSRPEAVRAVRLLSQAAQAAIVTSYQGQEVVTRWS